MTRYADDILIVDNYDSFTYNLAQQVEECVGRRPVVVRNDVLVDDLDLTRFSHIILSPGPGSPDVAGDVGICSHILDVAEVPVLGVCLGHQLLASHSGGKVSRAPEPMHGRISKITHTGDSLFDGIPETLDVVRYHSLAVSAVPEVLTVIAVTEDRVVMGLRHQSRPLWGVQFHPESILSEWGTQIIRNFLSLDADGRKRPQWRVEVRSLGTGLQPQVVHNALYADDERSFWLDSNSNDHRSSLSVMGTCEGVLSHVLEYQAGSGITMRESSSGVCTEIAGDIFAVLETNLHAFSPIDAPLQTPGFALGYIGYLGYGLKADTCGVPDPVPSSLPDARLTFAERVVAFDHSSGDCLLLALVSDGAREDLDTSSQAWIEATAQTLTGLRGEVTIPAETPEFPDYTELERAFSFSHSREAYIDRIRRCQRFILDGESYEICLTNTAELSEHVDPIRAYALLRTCARVPYGALLRCGSFSVLSASPECFLTLDAEGVVETRPIKGTRPRGGDSDEDRILREDLLSSEKDRAENLMIVDLMRNDLNTVCEHGSVTVPKIFDVESFPSVHQLISTVTGRLRPESSAVDCVRHTFPGGSMTGAPKVRTLQIIDALETGARGVYSGAIGWFSLDGALSLSIVIRTLIVQQEKTTFGVGGAITHLSDPVEEWNETLVKARVVGSALLAARRACLNDNPT